MSPHPTFTGASAETIEASGDPRRACRIAGYGGDEMSSSELVLHEAASRILNEEEFGYSAYFPITYGKDDELVRRVTEFARSVRTSARLVNDGAPFWGMACHVVLEQLTAAEVDRFREQFRPAEDVAIPVLK